MTLLHEIEAFMATHSMSATAFGLSSINDPAFVPNLRNGRDPKMSTVERVRGFMAEYAKNSPVETA